MIADANVSDTNGGPWTLALANGISYTGEYVFSCEGVVVNGPAQQGNLTIGLANFWEFVFDNYHGMLLVVVVVGPSSVHSLTLPTSNVSSCQLSYAAGINGTLIDSTEAASKADIGNLPNQNSISYVQYTLSFTPLYSGDPVWVLTVDEQGSKLCQTIDAASGNLLHGGTC